MVFVSFNDAEATDTPLIAKLAREEGIEASILYASTRSVGKKAFGKMLLGVDKTGDNVERTLAFMNSVRGVRAQIEDEATLRRAVE